MFSIKESHLPGIGKKYQMVSRAGDVLVFVIHDDGRREIYQYDPQDPDEMISTFTLEDDEARQVAAIVGGMTYKPKALETIEMALNDLIIEWYRLESNSPCIGKCIGELDIRQKTGATIIAVVEKDQTQKVSPGPEHVLKADAMLVVAGDRKQIKALKNLLIHKES